MLARNWYYANQKSDLILKATEYNIKPRMIAMVAANPFRGVKTEIHIGTLSVSQCYATWCNKKEFPSIGTNGIIFHTHLRIKLRTRSVPVVDG
jgi:hypothetical protein